MRPVLPGVLPGRLMSLVLRNAAPGACRNADALPPAGRRLNQRSQILDLWPNWPLRLASQSVDDYIP